MDLDLITIKPAPCEIPYQKREVTKAFTLNDGTLAELGNALACIETAKQALAAKGFTAFKLQLASFTEDDEGTRVTLSVQGSRLETAEECAHRVKRQTQYNEIKWQKYHEHIAAVARRKELNRLTKHLTTEQLQTLQPLTVKD